jgi:DNA-binding LytR/AlgR family response regulator
MSEELKKTKVTYNDIPVFLLLIPCINALNYFLTYPNITFSWYTLMTFTIDTALGYAAWCSIRAIIIWLDRKMPYTHKPLKRIIVQLLLTSAAGLSIIIITTEIVNAIAKDTPVPSGFYTLDIFIFLIWFFVINGIYVGLYYYSQWSHSEKMRLEEKKLRQDGFTVRSGKQNISVSFENIAGIYVENDYAILVTRDHKKHLLDQSLDKIEKMLPDELFFRANRQFILHRQSITGFERIDNGKINLLVAASGHLPAAITVSRVKAAGFRGWFHH